MYAILFVGALPPNVTLSSLKATSVTVSWTQPPLSFTPVNYTVTLTRVPESGQQPCTEVAYDSETSLTNMTTINFTGLHEFSDYSVTVTAWFNEFDLSLSSNSSMEFTTLSNGECVDIIVHCSYVCPPLFYYSLHWSSP